jgi:hypothetical protein
MNSQLYTHIGHKIWTHDLQLNNGVGLGNKDITP